MITPTVGPGMKNKVPHMSRLLVVCWVWLLMIAIVGSVFAPLAHDHDAPLSSFVVRVVPDASAAAHDAGAGETDPVEQIANTCLLCAHFAGQPSVPANPARQAWVSVAATAEPLVRRAPPIFQALAWWRPALRAPPVITVSTNS